MRKRIVITILLVVTASGGAVATNQVVKDLRGITTPVVGFIVHTDNVKELHKLLPQLEGKTVYYVISEDSFNGVKYILRSIGKGTITTKNMPLEAMARRLDMIISADGDDRDRTIIELK